MSQTITLAEFNELQSDYERAYEAGLTAQPCTMCGEPVVELHAVWDFYSGSGTVLHGTCVRRYLLVHEAPTWWELAWDDFCLHRLNLMIPSPYRALHFGEKARSYSALRAKNRAEFPGDSFHDRAPDPWRYDDYMDRLLLCAGLPLELYGSIGSTG